MKPRVHPRGKILRIRQTKQYKDLTNILGRQSSKQWVWYTCVQRTWDVDLLLCGQNTVNPNTQVETAGLGVI